MRLLLIEPPSDAEAWEYSISSRENLGLGYLAAALRAEGHTVEIACCPAFDWSISDLIAHVKTFRPELIGVSFPFTDELPGTVGSIKILRDHLGPFIPIIAGGHAASGSAREILAQIPELTAVVRGEGEMTLLDVVRHIEQGLDFTSVRGLAMRLDNGIQINPNRELIACLDSLPFPARDILQNRRTSGKVLTEIYLSGSRGCPYRCSFCDIKTFYQNGKGVSWRGRSPTNIVGELRLLYSEFGSDPVYCFVDDQFVGPGRLGRETAKNFARELLQRKLEISFEISCRADTVDRETFALLKRAGLSGVYLGLDSGSQAALDRFQKDTTPERNVEAVAMLRELDIAVDIGFIMFDHWTTVDDLANNLSFLRRIADLGVPLHPSILLNTLKDYPDTPIAQRAAREGINNNSIEISRANTITQIRHELETATKEIPGGLSGRDYTNRLLESFRRVVETHIPHAMYMMK